MITSKLVFNFDAGLFIRQHQPGGCCLRAFHLDVRLAIFGRVAGRESTGTLSNRFNSIDLKRRFRRPRSPGTMCTFESWSRPCACFYKLLASKNGWLFFGFSDSPPILSTLQWPKNFLVKSVSLEGARKAWQTKTFRLTVQR